MNGGGLEAFFTVSEQLLLFLGSVLLGAGLGVIFDIFRIIRIIFPPAGRDAPTAAADMLYMLIFGLGVFLFSAVFGRGEVRFFYAAGAGLGALLYLLTIGSVITGIVRSCCNAIRAALNNLYGKCIMIFSFLFGKKAENNTSKKIIIKKARKRPDKTYRF